MFCLHHVGCYNKNFYSHLKYLLLSSHFLLIKMLIDWEMIFDLELDEIKVEDDKVENLYDQLVEVRKMIKFKCFKVFEFLF